MITYLAILSQLRHGTVPQAKPKAKPFRGLYQAPRVQRILTPRVTR